MVGLGPRVPRTQAPTQNVGTSIQIGGSHQYIEQFTFSQRLGALGVSVNINTTHLPQTASPVNLGSGNRQTSINHRIEGESNVKSQTLVPFWGTPEHKEHKKSNNFE